MLGAPMLYFAPGFAFGPESFRPLARLLPEYSHVCADLGFQGQESIPRQGLARPLIGVGHSLGLAWLLESGLEFDGLVSLAGFARFTRAKDWPHGVSPANLRLMRKRLASDSKAMLHDFFELCACPEDLRPEAGRLVPDKLSLALDWLGAWDERERLSKLGCPLLALVSQDDRVVPEALARDSFANLDNAVLRFLPQAGHCPQLTRPELCANTLRGFISRICG